MGTTIEDSCQYCGTTVEEKLLAFRNTACFEFHHIDPAKKSPEYDNLIRRKLSSEQLDEVDKCALLCGNCHDTLHGQNLTVPVTFTQHVEGTEPIEHVLTCQVICDFTKHEATLFSDQFPLLDLFRVQIGSNPPSIMSALQLEPVLNSMIERTRTEGALVVLTLSGDRAFTVTQLTGSQFEQFVNLDFPLTKAELTFKSSDGNGLNLFLRPGHFITTGDHRIFARTYGRMTLKTVSEYSTGTESDAT